jgi:cytochrome c-type biogenesis protein CcmH/NrfG
MSESDKKGFLDRIMSEADDSTHPFLQKIQDNIRIILLVVGTVLLAAAIYTLNSLWQDRKVSQANSRLEVIMAQDSHETRISRLEAFLGEAPGRLKGAILLELARTSMETGDFDKAAQSFRELGRLDRDMRPVALLGQAKAYELMEEHAQALRLLQEESAAIPDEFEAQYLSLLSFNAEKAGEYAVALEAYQGLRDMARGDTGFIDYKIETLSHKL